MELELTHRNHFRFGYADQHWFEPRRHPDQVWHVRYGECEGEPGTFLEECVRAARLIRDSTDLPIHVMLSGGYDSEAALRSFVAAGIPVRAATMRFRGRVNMPDVIGAAALANALGVPIDTYDLDLAKFWDAEVFEYCRRSGCVSPQLACHMWLMDRIQGYPVLASGECYLVKRLPEGYQSGVSEYPRSQWDMLEREKIASWYRHLIARGRAGCAGFFQYTPGQMLSWLSEPRVRELVDDQHAGKLSTMSSKHHVYSRHFPGMRERGKLTGFESVMELDRAVRAELRELHPGQNAIARMEYHGLVHSLRDKRGRDAGLEAFYARNLGQYGINGTNNGPDPDEGWPSHEMPLGMMLSRDNHFVWGYDRQRFNWRRNYTSVFWTDYGVPRRPVMTLREELALALREIHEHNNGNLLTLSCTNSPFSAMVRAALEELGIPFAPWGQRDLSPGMREFEKYMETFFQTTRCVDPRVAYIAWCGEQTERFTIYDGGVIRLFNHGTDDARNPYSPPRWALVDNERNHAIDRWMIATGRRGITSLMKWSPELMAAYLRHPIIQGLLRSNARNNVEADDRILGSLYGTTTRWWQPMDDMNDWVMEKTEHFKKIYPRAFRQSNHPITEVDAFGRIVQDSAVARMAAEGHGPLPGPRGVWADEVGGDPPVGES
jgi:hypothetical protein